LFVNFPQERLPVAPVAVAAVTRADYQYNRRLI